MQSRFGKALGNPKLEIRKNRGTKFLISTAVWNRRRAAKSNFGRFNVFGISPSTPSFPSVQNSVFVFDGL